jgi:biotin/methionine sulfoxide reductase
MTLYPYDAALHGLSEGDIVRDYYGCGVCLAGVRLLEHQRRNVVRLWTGAWFDPPEVVVYCEGGG